LRGRRITYQWVDAESGEEVDSDDTINRAPEADGHSV
jgi:hypothetical protein